MVGGVFYEIIDFLMNPRCNAIGCPDVVSRNPRRGLVRGVDRGFAHLVWIRGDLSLKLDKNRGQWIGPAVGRFGNGPAR